MDEYANTAEAVDVTDDVNRAGAGAVDVANDMNTLALADTAGHPVAREYGESKAPHVAEPADPAVSTTGMTGRTARPQKDTATGASMLEVPPRIASVSEPQEAVAPVCSTASVEPTVLAPASET